MPQKTIYQANIRDICLLPTDVTLAVDRATKELNALSYRSKHRISLEEVTHPTTEGEHPYLNNFLGPTKIPSDNIIIRLFPDGVEQLTEAYDSGNIRALLSYVTGGMRISLIYGWNISNAGIYARDVDTDTMEIEWK